MTIQQISVFVENKVGNLAELINLLSQNDIDLMAISVAETQEYGVIRLIVNDTERAEALLAKNGWVHIITPVLAVTIVNESGQLAKILTLLAQAGVGVEYAYSFLSKEPGHVHMVFRVEDNEKAENVLMGAGVRLVDDEDVKP